MAYWLTIGICISQGYKVSRGDSLSIPDLPFKLFKTADLPGEEEQRQEALDDSGGQAEAAKQHQQEGNEVSGTEPHGDEANEPDGEGDEEVDAAPVALADLTRHVGMDHGKDVVVHGEGQGVVTGRGTAELRVRVRGERAVSGVGAIGRAARGEVCAVLEGDRKSVV